MAKLRKADIALIKFLFLEAGEKSWSSEKIRSYLKELKESSGSPDIKTSISKNDLGEMIISWITAHDPDLSLLKKHHYEFEAYRQKVVYLFEIPTWLNDQRSSIETQYKDLSYDLEKGNHKNFEPFAIEKSTTNVTILFGKEAERRYTIRLAQSDVPRTVWKDLEEIVEGKGNLTQINLVVERGIRTISQVQFDFDKKEMIISTDAKTYQSEEEKESPEKRLKDTIQTLIEPLSIAQPEKKVQQILESSNKFPVNAVLHAREFDDILMIPYEFTFSHSTHGELMDELVKDHVKSIKPPDVKREARNHYEKHGSFKNFLSNYGQFDAEKNAELVIAIQGKSAKTIAYGYIVVFIDNNGETQAFRVSFERSNGRFVIEGKDAGRRQYEIILNEIRSHIQK